MSNLSAHHLWCSFRTVIGSASSYWKCLYARYWIRNNSAEIIRWIWADNPLCSCVVFGSVALTWGVEKKGSDEHSKQDVFAMLAACLPGDSVDLSVSPTRRSSSDSADVDCRCKPAIGCLFQAVFSSRPPSLCCCFSKFQSLQETARTLRASSADAEDDMSVTLALTFFILQGLTPRLASPHAEQVRLKNYKQAKEFSFPHTIFFYILVHRGWIPVTFPPVAPAGSHLCPSVL